jgi:hypothetical protein
MVEAVNLSAMIDAADTSPATLGEIFDRGTRLAFRRIAVWAMLYAVIEIPYSLYEGYHPFVRTMFASIARAVHPSGAPPLATHAASGFGASQIITLLLPSLVFALPNIALMYAMTRDLAGESTSIPLAYRFAVGRWIFAVCVALADLVIFWVSAIALAVVVFVVGAIAYGLFHPFLGNGPAVIGCAVLLALPAGLLALAVASWIQSWSFVSACVVALEPVHPLAALSRAAKLLFARGEKRRAAIVGAALYAMAFGGTAIVDALGERLVDLAGSSVPGIALAMLSDVLVIIVVSAIVVCYYRDLLVRRDGLDLRSIPIVAPEASTAHAL